ncbi:MAG: DUF7475 family protein [Halobacteriota archaeon]
MSVTDTAGGELGWNLDSLTAIHWLAILLAGITGVIHLYISIDALPGGLGIAFVLAGLGFFGAIVLFLYTSGRYRRWLYIAGIPFVLLQIVLYYVYNEPSTLGDMATVDVVDKVVQVVLVLVLAYLLYVERDAP